MRASLIYNPHAGRVAVHRELADVVQYLGGCGWQVRIVETSAPQQATALARQAVRDGAQVVVAAGGDGTVNEVSCGLIGTDVALGVLPVGTTNVWALQTRIPMVNPIFAPSPRLGKLMVDLEERTDHALPTNLYRAALLDAARVLVHGDMRQVDVGRVKDRVFLLWAGVGLDAAVAENVPPEDKKQRGTWAVVEAAIDTVREYESTAVTLTVDGEVRRVQTSLVVASNVQMYGGTFPLGARACLDDGLLDVCVFMGEGLFTFVQHLARIASRQHLRDPEIEYFQARELTVEAAHPLPVHADDEPFTTTPVTIRVLPRALKVIVPRKVPSYLFTQAPTRS